MVDTNALLSIAFAMIADFTNVVHVPPSAVPQKPDDLVMCVIGSPSSPVELYLVHRKGTEFRIARGVVQSYRCPGSFFSLQDFTSVSNFTGTAKLTSEEAVQVASQAIQRLAKSGDPLTNGTPRIKYASTTIPFLEVNWPTPPGYIGSDLAASVEIDRRTGDIVSLFLLGPNFRNPAYEAEIKAKVYTPEPRRAPPPVKHHPYAMPATNEVTQAIGNWLLFCRKLGLDPGGQTNLEHVNWEETYVYTNPFARAVTCRVSFNNQACFDSTGGVPFNYFAADVCFRGRFMERPGAEWKPFEGVATKNWKDMVSEVETRIVQKLGIPQSVLDAARPFQRMRCAEVGATGLIRSLTYWHREPREPEGGPAMEDLASYLCAELDVATGQVKLLAFQDPELIRLIKKALQEK